MGIWYNVFFFGARKDPFNGSLAALVKVTVLWRMPGILRQLFELLPNVPLYSLYAIPGMRAKCSGGTVCADSWIALILAVILPVCGAVFQRLVFRANNTVIEFVINIFTPLVAPLHRLRALVCCGEHSAVIKHLFADTGRPVGGICNNTFHLGKSFCYLVIHLVKSYAVMDIAGSDHCLQLVYHTV